MFNNYSPMGTYLYLELLFFSVTLGLLIAKVGVTPIKLLFNVLIAEVIRYVKHH